jgi:hypothetical protein
MLKNLINLFKKKDKRRRLYLIFDGPAPREFGTLMGTIFDISDIYTSFMSTNTTHISIITDKSNEYIINNLLLNINPKYGLGIRHYFLIFNIDTLKLESFITTELLNQMQTPPMIKYNFEQDRINALMNESGEKLNNSIDNMLKLLSNPIETSYTTNKKTDEQELDELLDKINVNGIDSLTNEEKDKMNRLSRK